jgi:imidazolonepropionase
VNGAAALGIADDVGQVAPGFSADLALFAVDDYREVPYWFGAMSCARTWVRGQPCDW